MTIKIMLNNIIKNKKGSTAILLTMMVLISIFSVTLITSSIINNNIKMGRDQVHSTKAFFAAESGAEKVLWEARVNNFNFSGCPVGQYVNFDNNPAVCGENVYSYSFSNNASTTVKYIKFDGDLHVLHSKGNYKEIQRRIEISF